MAWKTYLRKAAPNKLAAVSTQKNEDTGAFRYSIDIIIPGQWMGKKTINSKSFEDAVKKLDDYMVEKLVGMEESNSDYPQWLQWGADLEWVFRYLEEAPL